MNNQQQKTLQAIWSLPVAKNIVFSQIESLLLAMGCEIMAMVHGLLSKKVGCV